MKVLKKILIASVFCLSSALAEPALIHLVKDDKHVDLFGTIHLGKPDFYPLPTPVTTALKNADALAVEMDITDPKLLAESAIWMKKLVHPAGKSYLDATRLEKLRHVAGKAADKIARFKPALSFSLIGFLAAQEMGYTEISVDVTLIQQAKNAKKTILSLETPAEQLGVIAAASDAEGLALFDLALEQSQSIATALQYIEDVWRHNAAERAKALIAEMRDVAPAFTKAMTTTRNQHIARAIAEQNNEYKHLFVAIGALHVHGDDNVVTQLQRLGYVRVSSRAP